MKILYLSCHEILQYDECSLFAELGHEVFCPGSIVYEENMGDAGLRPGLPKCKDYDDLMAEWHTLGKEGCDNKERITKEFAQRFDIIIVMHLPVWVTANWDAFKASGKPIILRTIGQFVSHNEKQMKPYIDAGLQVVRYSPCERTNPNFCGEHELIRFYKDPEEYKGWTGENKEVICMGQDIEKREPACNFRYMEQVTRPFPRAFYGPGSETLNYGHGSLSFKDLKRTMRENRVFMYGGTHPASYTLLYCEALLTSIPIVAVGPKQGHPHKWFPGHHLYEVSDLFLPENNDGKICGFSDDDPKVLQKHIKSLLDDYDLAKEVSKNARELGIKLFGKQVIKKQWQEYLSRWE